jgi:predicted enzyme related to lactoylglutathione lyase
MEYCHITTDEQAQLGGDGCLIKRQGREPAGKTMINSYVCIIDVLDTDEYLKQTQKHDGKTAMEKRSRPHISWLAYCFDT